MKKLLILLLCLTLLPILPTTAEEAAQLPIFRVTMARGDGSETTIGSAMLYLSENLLLTALPITEGDEDALTAYGPDGTAYGVAYILESQYGLQVLVIEPEANMAGAPSSWKEDAGRLLVGVTANGLRYAEPALSVSRTKLDGLDAYLVSAREPLLPGAMLMDGDGAVAGVVVAVWGEGENRYVALPTMAVTEVLMSGIGEEFGDDPSCLTGLELTYDGGIVTVDWSGCKVDGVSEDSVFIVFYQDVENVYYSYFPVEDGSMSQEIGLVPGRSYNIWVQHVHGEVGEVYLPEEQSAVRFDVPEGTFFTDYSFTNECYLAWAPINETPDLTTLLAPVEPITAQSLTDLSKSLYLQVTNTYAVDEEIELPMLAVLYTPEGFVFFNVNGYIFVPEYQENDVWSVDITDLFASYQSFGGGKFVPGEYTLRYTLGDQWGGEVTFTLE